MIKKCKSQVATAKRSLFDDLARMSFQAMYASSYRSFIKSKDFEKVKENVLKEGGLERTLAQLQKYADGRNIEENLQEEKESEAQVCDFHTIRANNTAAVYFRRFLQHEFSDQNFTFLSRVQEFKAVAEKLEILKTGTNRSRRVSEAAKKSRRHMSVGGSALFQGAAGRTSTGVPAGAAAADAKGKEESSEATAVAEERTTAIAEERKDQEVGEETETKANADSKAKAAATTRDDGAEISGADAAAASGGEAGAKAKSEDNTGEAKHVRDHSFRSIKLIKGLEDDVQFKAQFILDTFVKEDSPFQINLRADNRAAAIEAVQGGDYSRNVFEKVEYEIQRTIKHDAFPRFKKSSYYQRYHDIASHKMKLRRVSVSQISYPMGFF